VDVITSPEAGPDKGCSVVLSSGSGSSGSDPKSNSYAESEFETERGLESEAWPGAVSESKLYSGTGSLPARVKREPPCGPCRGCGGHVWSAHEVVKLHAMAE
jgi:hypothetical protein